MDPACLVTIPIYSVVTKAQSRNLMQSERAKQETEAALLCVTTSNPLTWRYQLPGVEHRHNSPINTSTGLLASCVPCITGHFPPRRLRYLFLLSRLTFATVSKARDVLCCPATLLPSAVPLPGPSSRPTIAVFRPRCTPRARGSGLAV